MMARATIYGAISMTLVFTIGVIMALFFMIGAQMTNQQQTHDGELCHLLE